MELVAKGATITTRIGSSPGASPRDSHPRLELPEASSSHGRWKSHLPGGNTDRRSSWFTASQMIQVAGNGRRLPWSRWRLSARYPFPVKEAGKAVLTARVANRARSPAFPATDNAFIATPTLGPVSGWFANSAVPPATRDPRGAMTREESGWIGIATPNLISQAGARVPQFQAPVRLPQF